MEERERGRDDRRESWRKGEGTSRYTPALAKILFTAGTSDSNLAPGASGKPSLALRTASRSFARRSAHSPRRRMFSDNPPLKLTLRSRQLDRQTARLGSNVLGT